jgi:ribosomal protein S6
MKVYELTYIISPEITSEEATAKAGEIETAIHSREGTILKQSNPVAKTLAFPVAGRASGFFGVLEFQLEPEKLVEIKELISKDKKIVRNMVIVKEPVRIRKERRSKRILAETPAVLEQKIEIESAKEKEEKPASVKSTIEKEKVELKDIEQQLDEILG